MTKPSVLISMETFEDTTNHDFGRAFITALCREDERLIPEQLGLSEDYDSPYIDIEDFVENWWAMPSKSYFDGKLQKEGYWGPMWRRRRVVTSRGSIKHGTVTKKGYIIPASLGFDAKWHKQMDFNHLFDAWLQISKPEIAMLHVFTSMELPTGLAFDDPINKFFLGSFGGKACPGIPNMGWAMAYGGDMRKDVMVDPIRQAGFLVDEYDSFIVVRVTENLSDVVDDFAHFSQRRALLKTFFRPDMFKIQEEPEF